MSDSKKPIRQNRDPGFGDLQVGDSDHTYTAAVGADDDTGTFLSHLDGW